MGSTLFNLPKVLRFYNEILEDKCHRYKSWEHCFSAFQTITDNNLLSLHLGFYLASWGMYRGSSGLLQKDYKVHIGAVKIIQSKEFSNLHCAKHEVSRKNINQILDLKNSLSNHYSSLTFKRNGADAFVTPTDTLITKVMLGTMGCIPAYDRYYIDGIKLAGFKGNTVNRQSLNNLFDFSENPINIKEILKAQKEIAKQGMHYPVMKLVDMYFWTLGFDVEK